MRVSNSLAISVETMDDFSNAFAMPRTVTRHKTAVFWNVEDFPFPAELPPCVIGRKIIQSLRKRGYGGYTSIFAYSVKRDFPDEMLAGFLKARIVFLPQVPEDQYERVHRMLHDIYFWAFDAELVCTSCTEERINLVVISNDIQGKITFGSRLEYVSGGCCYTLLSQPRDIPYGMPLRSFWQGGGLLDYGKVICQPSSSSRDCTSSLKRKTRPDTDSQD